MMLLCDIYVAMSIAIVTKNVTTFISLYLLCLEDHRVTLETISIWNLFS